MGPALCLTAVLVWYFAYLARKRTDLAINDAQARKSKGNAG
jgi:hypothetical protein